MRCPTKIRPATVILIQRDATQGGYRVRFRVLRFQPGDRWSTVQTDPPIEVRRTRWIGQTVEVVTPAHPAWHVDDEVRLTLEPYYYVHGDTP